MKPDGNINILWGICSYSDADYAGHNDTRKITTGHIVIVNGAVIDWRLQIHKKVSLSGIETKYSSIM